MKAPLLLGAPHEVAFDVTGVRAVFRITFENSFLWLRRGFVSDSTLPESPTKLPDSSCFDMEHASVRT